MFIMNNVLWTVSKSLPITKTFYLFLHKNTWDSIQTTNHKSQPDGSEREEKQFNNDYHNSENHKA